MTGDVHELLRKSARLDEQIETLQRRGEHLRQDTPEEPWQPPFDLYHVDDFLFIDIELPGVHPDSIAVEAEDGVVRVHGHKPALQDLPDREEVLRSRHFGPFSCQFALPPGHALSTLEQRMEHGVLHLKAHLRAADPS